MEKCLAKWKSSPEFVDYLRLRRRMYLIFNKEIPRAISRAGELTKGMHRFYRGYAKNMALYVKLGEMARAISELKTLAYFLVEAIMVCIGKHVDVAKYSVLDRGTRLVFRDRHGRPVYETRDPKLVQLFYDHRHSNRDIKVVEAMRRSAMWRMRIYAQNLGKKPREVEEILERRAGLNVA